MMLNSRCIGITTLFVLHLVGISNVATCEGQSIQDKTLVVWASPDNLEQHGGTALTIDNGDGSFDGIVFGELAATRWMPGSNGFARTEKNQDAWPPEVAESGTFVQMAIVYEGDQISVYRDGKPYAKYKKGPQQTFGSHPVVMFGRRHLDIKDDKNSFAGRIKDARIYDKALDEATISSMKPGEPLAEHTPWAWWSFGDEGLMEKTGRFNEMKLIGDVSLKNGSLVLPGNGATFIATISSDASSGSPVPQVWNVESPVPDAVVRSARILREKFLSDPYRPRYHFCVPEDMGLPGDPNGAFYHEGRYHLMYLYERNGGGFCWGHISSKDLVHWRHHPDAIGPGEGDEGCFSGGAFVDDDGTAYLSYWMLWGAKGIGLASSREADFERWKKSEANPIVKSTEWGITEAQDADGKTIHYGSADPSNIWKKDGRYYMLTGSLLVLEKFGRKPEAPIGDQGDRLYLFVSDDLKKWDYLHVFYDRKPEWTDRSEDNMCPSFLPLPSSKDGGARSGKHLLLFISHNKGCQYYVGDYRDDHFFPDNHGRMTWADNTYFAPEALIDGSGRQIMWAWLTDNPAGEKQKGWSGVYGLPRSLWLGEDGTLRMAPVKELEALREHEEVWTGMIVGDGKPHQLSGVAGDACEIQADITSFTAKSTGFRVRASDGGEEQTLVYYDAAAKELVLDSTRSGKEGRPVLERAPFVLREGEPLTLRIFVDKSVIEVYANDRQAICRRVYPTRDDSLSVVAFSEGGDTTFETIKAWRMAPSQPY